MKKPQKRNQIGAIGNISVLIALVLVLIGIFLWPRLEDHITVMRYEPTPEIAAIADRATMVGDGRFYFYASQPVLEGTQIFNSYCNRREEKSAILGCYDGKTIYIFDVTEERLSGIEEVTAAHEMLHAAYDRLSKERISYLEPLLQAEYDKQASDELKERMAYYDRTEPGQHFNELHSIIGTEMANISPELETHYRKYFSDRAAVVGLHASYSSAFQESARKIELLATELNDLAESINRSTEEYNQRSAALNADIQTFNQRAESGFYRTQAAFDAERAQLVNRSEQLNAERQQIEYNLAAYEGKLQEYKALTSEAEDLQNSIDSSLAPAPAI